MPPGYQPQGQYPSEGFQLPSSQSFLEGAGNVPTNYQPYVQPSYGPLYAQPFICPGMNMVWDPSQNQQNLQPNVQLPYQDGQHLVSGPN